MTVLVACETLLLVLLVLLVAGLLRSHAEILRRLGPPEAESGRGGSALPEPARRAGTQEGHDVVGVTLERDAVKIGLGADSPPTLLAFLSTGCTACQGFWDDVRAGLQAEKLPAGIRFVLLTKGPSHESPSRLRELAPGDIPVVMSSEAWTDYAVPAAPYFVYLEGGRVQGEGSAGGWKQIGSLLRDAIEDRSYGRGGEERTSEVDRVLAAAGIGPGDPSLYPAGRPDGTEQP
jgi:hypothetical protein